MTTQLTTHSILFPIGSGLSARVCAHAGDYRWMGGDAKALAARWLR